MLSADIQVSYDGYCTMARVREAMPNYTFTSSTRPTDVQAAIHIRTVYHTINGILDNLGYITPVASSNPTSIRILGRLNMLGAASLVQGAAYSVNQETSEHKSRLMARYELELAELEKGEKALLDAERMADYTPRKDEQEPFGEMVLTSDGLAAASPEITMDTEF